MTFSIHPFIQRKEEDETTITFVFSVQEQLGLMVLNASAAVIWLLRIIGRQTQDQEKRALQQYWILSH